MAFHPHSNATQTAWDKGRYQVMVQTPNNTRPIGFCDDAGDEHVIIDMAESEGAEISIDKRTLKTGREIWTVRSD